MYHNDNVLLKNKIISNLWNVIWKLHCMYKYKRIIDRRNAESLHDEWLLIY